MDERLRRRLRKLIATAAAADRDGSDAETKREAEVARSLARELIDAHGLAWSDIEGIEEDAEPSLFSLEACDRETPWKIMLANAVAEFFGCAAVVSMGARVIDVIGRPPDVEAVRYMYAAIARQLEEDADRAWLRELFPVLSEKEWKRTFLLSAADRVRERMAEGRREARTMSSCLVRQDAAMEKIMSTIPKEHASERVLVGDNADHAGRSAGDRVSLAASGSLPEDEPVKGPAATLPGQVTSASDDDQ